MIVLVVEDDDAVRDLVVTTLTGDGHTIITAQDGLEALAIIETCIPDAIVLDVHMPNMNGFEVLNSLRRTPETEAVPILMLTARATLADVERAKGLGATDFIAKPFAPRVLLRHLDRLLNPRDETEEDDAESA